MSACSCITEINEYTFQRCENLKQFNIPDAVQTVSFFAFNGCNKLKVRVPKSVVFFWKKAFYGCRGLVYLDADGNVEPNDNADDLLFDPDDSKLEVDIEGATIKILVDGVYQSSRLNSI